MSDRISEDCPKHVISKFTMLILFLLLLPESSVAKEIPFTTIEFPPENFKQDNRVVGVSVDIISAVMANIGHTVKVDLLPFERAKIWAAEGRYAGIFTITKNSYRESVYHFPDNPLLQVRDVFFKRKRDNISWQVLSDLKAYRVSYTNGYNYQNEFKTAIENHVFREQTPLMGGSPELRHFGFLAKSRTDIFICEVNVGQYLIKSYAPRFDSIDYIPKVIGKETGHYLAFSKKWPDSKKLMREFDKKFVELKLSGELKKIYERWGVIGTFKEY